MDILIGNTDGKKKALTLGEVRRMETFHFLILELFSTLH
jgi:hypothetical protein